MPTDAVPPDPWSAFLDWLSTVLVPNWGGLIELLPISLVLFVIGPIVSLLALGWAWHLLRRRRGRVQRSPAQASPVPRADDGTPLFPANAPYCEEHALVYPPRARRCAIDQAPLAVACPVDGTIRAAEIQTCAACGTRFTLGAGSSPLLVTSAGGPPEGGAAAA
jgi:hypothetical protein